MSDRDAWSWRHAIIKSDLHPTTRHVLLTISCFMNEVGGGCYPTQEQLATASGLSDRAVRKHLDLAVKAGWLKRKEHGFRGQKWRNHEYEAGWPTQHVDARNPHIGKGAEQGSGPFMEAAEPRSGKVRNKVPTNSPVHQSTSSLRDEQARARFAELWSIFPLRPGQSRKTALKAFLALGDRDQVECLEGARRYAAQFEVERKARNETAEQARRFVPALVRWIENEGWADLPAPAPRDVDVVLITPDSPDYELVLRHFGDRVRPGKSGRLTVRAADLEQARAAA